MDKDLNLNTSGVLPDGTAASQSGGFGASASELRSGIVKVDGDKPPVWTEDMAVSEPFKGVDSQGLTEVGGFLGRPQGWQR